jgi:hypothetical protein
MVYSMGRQPETIVNAETLKEERAQRKVLVLRASGLIFLSPPPRLRVEKYFYFVGRLLTNCRVPDDSIAKKTFLAARGTVPVAPPASAAGTSGFFLPRGDRAALRALLQHLTLSGHPPTSAQETTLS